MAIILPPLPFAYDALAPVISAETLKTHHGKHHQAYVDKTNATIENSPHNDASLEQIIAAAEAEGNTGLFNNAAQSWNHAFYWNSLTPETSEPKAALAEAIDASFGSLNALRAELLAQGTAHFASGWVWMLARGDSLSVAQTHDAATFATGDAKPVLVIDLWEHAYYLDHKNMRPNYLNGVIGKYLNWDFAAENFSRVRTWAYPV